MEKLNILITGPNGFLARELADYFSDKVDKIKCENIESNLEDLACGCAECGSAKMHLLS